jgi:ABC-type sugar transport system ATPase subunit
MAPGGYSARRLVGVRPHDLAPTANGESDAFTLTGELALIEPAGPLHYLDVDVGGQMVKATCADPDGLVPGAAIKLSAPLQAIHLFDRESGLRVNA